MTEPAIEELLLTEMIGQYLGYGALSALFGAVLYANAPTRLTIGGVVPTAKYLAEAKVKKLDSEKDVLTAKEQKAGEIFNESPVLVMAVRRPGCSFCRKQASELSAISDDLKKRNVRLIGVLHEIHGADQFRPFLKGDLYYDADKHFFGPQQRWLPLWMGFLRFSTYLNGYKTSKAGFKGNLEGEGRLLGGVYLINKDQVVFSHLEQEWGDEVDVERVLEAVKKL